jgi:hypothetical protein
MFQQPAPACIRGLSGNRERAGAAEKDGIADSADEEIAQIQVELTRLRTEERRGGRKRRHCMAAEDALRSEQARWHEQADRAPSR